MGNNRFTVTVSYTYDVSDDDVYQDYNTTDLVEAAAIDEDNYTNYPYFVGEEISNGVQNYNAVVRAVRLSE